MKNLKKLSSRANNSLRHGCAVSPPSKMEEYSDCKFKTRDLNRKDMSSRAKPRDLHRKDMSSRAKPRDLNRKDMSSRAKPRDLNRYAKKALACVLSIAMILTAAPLTGIISFAAGGSLAADENGVYLIEDKADLTAFAELVNGGQTDINAKLTADIVLNDGTFAQDGTFTPTVDGTIAEQWTPIGNSGNTYSGIFDGNGKTVSGLYTNNTSNYQGLFGYIENGTVKNLGLDGGYVKGGSFAGGVCGYNKDHGTIINCYNTGVVSGNDYIGGVCGDNRDYGTIIDCYNTGAVSGSSYIGGVCGNSYRTITNCYNTGNVSGTGSSGGVCGESRGGTITDCYNLGKIIGSFAGGVCGYNSVGTVISSYNAGDISGNYYVGGVCGNNYGDIKNSYNLGKVSGSGYCTGGVFGAHKGGTVTNSYNTGEVSATSGTAGGVCGDIDCNLVNCYSLANCVTNGGGGFDGTVMPSAQFANGEVAYLLNGDQADIVFGQTVGADLSPVYLKEDKSNQVFKITYSGDYSGEVYVNFGGSAVLPRAADTDDFIYLFTNSDGSDFVNSNITADAVLTVTKKSKIENIDGKEYRLIYSKADLEQFRNLVNSGNAGINGKLMADIVLNDGTFDSNGNFTPTVDGTAAEQWTPIGNNDKRYTGIFDGDGHTISGLYINGSNSMQGLFGYINGGTVKNSGVVGGYVKGGDYVGGIIGLSEIGTSITNCYNTATVNGNSNLGGICGQNHNSDIDNCYNTGAISGVDRIGGVTGKNGSGSEITNCYNTGAVSGNIYVGGVRGEAYKSTILNCYSLTGCVIQGDGGNNGIEKSADEFANGEVAYLLNGDQANPIYGQTIGTDLSPVFIKSDKSNQVFKITYTGDYVGESYATFGGATVLPTDDTVVYSFTTDGSTAFVNENITADIAVTVTKGIKTQTIDGKEFYLIYTKEQLTEFASMVNGGNAGINGKLMADIVLNDGTFAQDGTFTPTDGISVAEQWTPIGNKSIPYSGIFDGNGKTVSGLYINNTSDYQGLFGYIENGTVKNLRLVGGYVNGGDNVGGVCGLNDGLLINCFNMCYVTGDTNIGGVCGYTKNKTTNCYNSGTVNGQVHTGGVSGENYQGRVDSCYNDGTIIGDSYTGGVNGNNDHGTIINCYNFGAVSGSVDDIGGISGDNYYGTISNSYNTGTVSGTSSVGGICGLNSLGGTIKNCYNTGNISGYSFIGGVSGSDIFGGTLTNCYYLVGCAADGSGVVQFGVGNDAQGSPTPDVAGATTPKTEAQFANGEVAYLLNGDQAAIAFGQTINQANADLSPLFIKSDKSNQVFKITYTGDYVGESYATSGGATTLPVAEQGIQYTFTANGSAFTNSGITADTIVTVTKSLKPEIVDGVTYYYIYNKEQLEMFRDMANITPAVNAKLMADIVLNDGTFTEDGTFTPTDGSTTAAEQWTPIGNILSPYAGIFDGNGYTVGGIYINGDSFYQGLFGYVQNGTIKNLGVVSGYIKGVNYVGGVCVTNRGTIENCYNTATVVGTGEAVGGVCGDNGGTTINCYNRGTVIGSGDVGGVVGGNYGIVENCYNISEISGHRYVGGVCGGNQGTVENCYNNGKVDGNSTVGGICGDNNGTIQNCYNNGVVSGTDSCVGGVCGNSYKIITNCYNTGAVDGNNHVGGVCGDNYDTITNCYYIVGCATDGKSVIQFGVGNGTQGSTTPDVAGVTTSKSAEEFANGSVSYLLNGDQSTLVYGQTLNQANADLSPVFIKSDKSNQVFKITYTGLYEGEAFATSGGSVVLPTVSGGDNYDIWFKIKDGAIFDGTNVTSDLSVEVIEGMITQNIDGVDFYLIYTKAQLEQFRDMVNGSNGYASTPAINGKLMENIVLNDGTFAQDGTFTPTDGSTTAAEQWTPIGNESNQYSGTFDGNGKTVSGIYTDSRDYQGMFGYIGVGTVENLGVINSYIKGDFYVGGVCGYNDGKINNCYNTGVVSGPYHVGGVCALNRGTIENCYNTGNVLGTGEKVGGVCGYNDDSGSIKNCYNTGAVVGTNYVGGICAQNENTIENCYNTGTVSGSGYLVGGACGDIYGTMTNCYSLSGCVILGRDGLDGIVKTEAQFASGEVANLLNSDKENPAFGQTLNGETPDLLPVFIKSDKSNQVFKVQFVGEVPSVVYVNNGANVTLPTPPDGANYAYSFTVNNANFDGKNITADVTVTVGKTFKTEMIDGKEFYLIYNKAQLEEFRNLVNGGKTAINGKLMENILLNDGTFAEDGTFTPNDGSSLPEQWTPIGNESNPYSGIFDGNGKTVNGLYINNTSDYQGLFGHIVGGTIKNLGVAGGYVKGGDFVGGICGDKEDSIIQNCYNLGKVTGKSCVGGICGDKENGAISNCYNTGTVSGNLSDIGGVCGRNYGGANIENCYNTGNISGDFFVSGVCGANYDNDGIIGNCYNRGTVSGTSYVGGICGWNHRGSTIENCYNTGEVSGTDNHVGGICGYNDTEIIKNCYNMGQVSGTGDFVGGICGYNYCSPITNCYNTGKVDGAGYNTGGVCGRNNDATLTNCYYIVGCATDGSGVVQFGVGNEAQGSTTPDVAGATTSKSADEFANGEVAYLLNGDQSTIIYGQTIGTDLSPVFIKSDKSNQVFKITYTGLYEGEAFATSGGSVVLPTVSGGADYEPWFKIKDGAIFDGKNILADAEVEVIKGMKTETDESVEYYLIYTKAQLELFRDMVNGQNGFVRTPAINGKLMADIVLNNGTFAQDGTFTPTVEGNVAEQWAPIGNTDNVYSGIFDGNGKTVIGLYINSSSDFQGLFCFVNGTVKNLGVVGGYVKGGDNAGGVCGDNGGNVTNCYNTGTVIGKTAVGGVCGHNWDTITNCYNTGTVSGENYVGGVCGSSYKTITNCYNIGKIIGTIGYTGGVCGANSGYIANCYNEGTVVGKDLVGGVCGANSKTITNCYNMGAVNASGNSVGGVCGYNAENLFNCYNTGVVTGASNIGGVCGFQHSGKIDNCYYLEKDGLAGIGGFGDFVTDFGGTIQKLAIDFENGSVTTLLNEYVTANSGVGLSEWKTMRLSQDLNGQPVFVWQSDVFNQATYIVVIPETVEVNNDFEISASSVSNLWENEKINVSLTIPTAGIELINIKSTDRKCHAWLYDGANQFAAGNQTVASFTNDGSKVLQFKVEETDLRAGTYVGTATFTVGLGA